MPLSKPIVSKPIVAAVVMYGFATSIGFAETHRLFDRGNTLVEAEHYSRVSDLPPQIKSSERCSGQSNLEYFWANSWFEFKLDVARLLHYHVSLRVASEKGTSIEVQAVDQSDATTTLATIDIPSTGSYTTYTNIHGRVITIPSGVQTLRFRNLSEGVNVDFVVFNAGSHADIVAKELASSGGSNPDRRAEGELQVRAVRHLIAVDDSKRTHIEIDLAKPATPSLDAYGVMQVAVLKKQSGKFMVLRETNVNARRQTREHSVTISATCRARLDPRTEHQIGFRVLQSESSSGTTNASSDRDRGIDLVAADEVMDGDWTLLDKVERRAPRKPPSFDESFFPFGGSFRTGNVESSLKSKPNP